MFKYFVLLVKFVLFQGNRDFQALQSTMSIDGTFDLGAWNKLKEQ